MSTGIENDPLDAVQRGGVVFRSTKYKTPARDTTSGQELSAPSAVSVNSITFSFSVLPYHATSAPNGQVLSMSCRRDPDYRASVFMRRHPLPYYAFYRSSQDNTPAVQADFSAWADSIAL